MKDNSVQLAVKACRTIMDRYNPRDLPPKECFFYHQGVFLSGMERLYDLTRKKEYFNYIQDYADYVLGPCGEVYGFCHELGLRQGSRFAGREMTMLDCRQPAVLLYRLFDETGDEKYMNAARTISASLYYWPVNEYGGYWHMLTQPNQMWLDSVYMCGPLSVKYAKRFGDTTLRKRAVKQVLLIDEKMKDIQTGLYYHGWDPTKTAEWANKKTGLSECIWGRAVGWYAAAIVDMLDDIPENLPEYKLLADIEAALLKALTAYQDYKNGLWYQVTDKPGEAGNWIETSSSCLFAYAYAKAIRKGLIPREQYISVLNKVFDGIQDYIYEDAEGRLTLDRICIGTCIESGLYEHYIQRNHKKNDLHGMGAFVLMCTETAKLNAQYGSEKAADDAEN